MNSEITTLYRVNDDETDVIEQYPKTISDVVYDTENGKFLTDTIREFTQHKEQDNEQAHEIGNINGLLGELNKIGTLTTLETTNKTNLVEAINEVFQTGNNVKSDMVDALLSVDGSLPITQSNNWSDIISAINEISTGKKIATGTLTTTVNTGFSITGLDFVPSVLIALRNTANTSPRFIVIASTDNTTPFNTAISLNTNTAYNANVVNISSGMGVVNISYTALSGSSGIPLVWLAIE